MRVWFWSNLYAATRFGPMWLHDLFGQRMATAMWDAARPKREAIYLEYIFEEAKTATPDNAGNLLERISEIRHVVKR